MERVQVEVCILTGADGENADDCSTHEHEAPIVRGEPYVDDDDEVCNEVMTAFKDRRRSAEMAWLDTGDDGAMVQMNTWNEAIALFEATYNGNTLTPVAAFGGVEVVRCEDCDRVNDDYAKSCAGCGARLS